MKFSPAQSKKGKMAALDELIAKCDEASTDPFKKKKAAIAAVPDEEEAEEMVAEEGEDEGEEAQNPDGLSDLDMEELLALYEKLKGQKEEG